MAFHKLIGAADAPTVDVEIPTPDGPVQVSLPRLDFVPAEVIERIDALTLERVKEVEVKRREAISAGGVSWEIDPAFRFPTDLDLVQRFLEELVPDHAAAIAKAEIGVRKQLWTYWENASKGDLGKLDRSAPSLPQKRASKKR